MKAMSATLFSLSLLAASGSVFAQIPGVESEGGPEPSAHTIVLAECIAYVVASQDGDAKDMSRERKDWIIAFAKPFDLEADIDGLNTDQRQTIVVEKLQQQYTLKKSEGTEALVRLYEKKCEAALEDAAKGRQ